MFGPYTASAVDMLDFFERRQEWSFATFGPPSHRGPCGPLEHLLKEAAEALEEAKKATHLLPGWSHEKLREEIIDCLFLVFDAADRAGMSYAEISKAGMSKLRKNQARIWPDWRTADPDKAIEHDRSGDFR